MGSGMTHLVAVFHVAGPAAFHQRAGRSETLGRSRWGACLYDAILRALVSIHTPLASSRPCTGGALIVSAFSNWSRYGHYAQTTVTSPRHLSCSFSRPDSHRPLLDHHSLHSQVGWLGLAPSPRAPFGDRRDLGMVHPVAMGGADPSVVTALNLARSTDGESTDQIDETAALLSEHAPFGSVRTFSNTGSTEFGVLDAAFQAGGVQLITEMGSGRRPEQQVR